MNELQRVTIAIKKNEFKHFVTKIDAVINLLFDEIGSLYIPISVTEMYASKMDDLIVIIFKKE